MISLQNKYLNIYMKLTSVFIMCSTLCTTAISAEISSPGGRTQIHGFLTQNWINTEKYDFFGKSQHEGGSLSWHELGINLRTQLSDRLDFSAQAIARDAGGMESSDNQILLDYMFADLNVFNWGENTVNLKLGRSRYQQGFYNATRDIAITRPSIILPQSVYYDIARTLITRHDGIVLHGNHTIKNSNYIWGLGYARDSGIASDDLEAIFLGNAYSGELETDYVSQAYFGGSFNNGFRFHLSTSTNKFKYKPSAFDFLGAGKSKAILTTLSFEYDNQNGHRVTQENFYGKFRVKDHGIPQIEIPYDSIGNYIQYTRYWNKYEAFVRYDYLRVRENDRKTYIALGLPKKALFARTWALGGRYFINNNLAVSAEFHRVEGGAWLSHIENPTILNDDKNRDWGIFAAQITYSF